LKINKLHHNQNILTIIFIFLLFYQNKFIRFAHNKKQRTNEKQSENREFWQV